MFLNKFLWFIQAPKKLIEKTFFINYNNESIYFSVIHFKKYWLGFCLFASMDVTPLTRQYNYHFFPFNHAK